MSAAPKLLHELPHIRAGIDVLCARDPVFGAVDFDYSRFNWGYLGAGFQGLVRIVAGQQVSTKAAKAICARVDAAIDPITPESVIAAGEDVLRGCGFSHPKVRYVMGAAEAVLDGSLDLEALADKSDEEVASAITALKGFGPWSAQIYLMFCLARPDIWPAGDLGIQEGLRRYRRIEERPDEAETLAAHEIFKPYGTAASLLLWYIKGLPSF